MRRVVNRFGKLGFRHAFQVQRFARYCVLLFDDQSGKLMSEVGALVGHLLVFTSQCATGFGPVRATFFTSRQPARGALDLEFGFPKEARVFNHSAVGVGGETIKAHINAESRFRLNHRFGQIGQVELNDHRDLPFACRLALECRAFQGQINRLRLPDGDPADLWNIDAAILKLDSLRNSERLMGAVFLLESGETRPLLKEVLKRPLAIGDGLLQQLRIDLFQPLETRPALKSGQFDRKLRPGDGFAGLLISLFSTLERPVEDEPSRARITSKRRLLFGSRINPEPVDLSLRHSSSGPLRVELFGNRLLGYGAGGRCEITLLGHIADNACCAEDRVS